MATDLSDIRKLVDESQFDVLSFSVDALTGDEELLCGIAANCIPCGKRNAAKKFLLTYSSSKNSKPCSTVTNPTSTEGEELDGLWRCIGVDFQVAWNKKEYLIRKLRKGYATVIDWTEARLVEGKNQQPLGAANYKSLTVRWLNCSRATVQAMALSLNTTPFVDPIINGEKQTGTWYNSGVTPSIAADGSGIITLQLSIQYRDIPFQVSAISSDASVETRQQLGLTTETPEPVVAVAGQVKTQQVTVLDDSSKNVHTNRDIGVAQETVNTVRSPDATVVTTNKTVQADALVVPDLEAGILKRIKNVWSKYFNRWDTSEEVETGIAQTTTATTITGTERTDTTEKTVQSAALTVTAFVQGFIRRIVNSVSKYPSRFNTTEDIQTAIPASVPEYIAALSENETVYRLEEKHAAAIPLIALGANDASVSLAHDLDAFLTHNYTKTRVVKAFPFAGEKTWTIWGDREIVTSQVYSDTLGRYWNDHSYLYHLYQEVTVKYFKTVDEAIAYIHLASGTEPAGGGYTVIDSAGSGWSRTGEFEYMGHKVRNKKLLMATYNYLEPLS